MLKRLQQIVILLVVSLFCISCSKVPATSTNPWQVLNLNTEATFADMAFTEDHNHGFLVGTNATLLETKDGGNTWQSVTPIELEEEKISYNGVSFSGEEGWITGVPSILLHTKDGGITWNRILLSNKLPGAPYDILALGPDSAEMVTNLGAIYRTRDGGMNWKAQVEGAVGVARNINRSADGKYVAVSARGNFYSTWEPGQTEWTPHQRNSSRRLQNMGFAQDGRLWLLARGGQIQFSSSEGEKWEEAIYPDSSTSWGLLDIAFRTPEEMWVAGGGGNLLMSTDGGKSWSKDTSVEDVPSNFYKIVFVSPEQGFILGHKGILLKYEPTAKTA